MGHIWIIEISGPGALAMHWRIVYELAVCCYCGVVEYGFLRINKHLCEETDSHLICN